ncbi:HAMP domain-containing protein, partial [Faecalispora jeddahensis]|uniref:HAMP domain-containing protein n=1 Tax=Faecalispora jeddahensis TaxID=1414721 RepID=UPI0028B0B493
MKLRDLSIRKKLLLSNFTMIIIPVALAVVVLIGTLLSFLSFTKGNGLGLLGGESISNYQLQLQLDALCNEIASERGALSGNDEITDLFTALEKDGIRLAIQVNQKSAYRSPGTGADELRGEAGAVMGEPVAEGEPFFFRKGGGFVYQTRFTGKSGAPVSILAVSQSLSYANGDYVMLEKIKDYVKAFAVVLCTAIVAVIALTGILLAGRMSKSILTPLDTLRRAANEIRDGNLDTPVAPESKDELGEVCGDFDEMRLRLKDSVETQQRYEQSRKELIAGISH